MFKKKIVNYIFDPNFLYAVLTISIVSGITILKINSNIRDYEIALIGVTILAVIYVHNNYSKLQLVSLNTTKPLTQKKVEDSISNNFNVREKKIQQPNIIDQDHDNPRI